MPYKNILLIDDDEEDHDIFKTALELVSGDLECTSISNAADALHKLATNQLDPDVIFLDLNMPIMNGQEFLIQLKKNQDIKDIPVIIYTTSANPATIELMKELGAKSFITKPNRFEKLVDILKPIIN